MSTDRRGDGAVKAEDRHARQIRSNADSSEQDRAMLRLLSWAARTSINYGVRIQALFFFAEAASASEISFRRHVLLATNNVSAT